MVEFIINLVLKGTEKLKDLSTVMKKLGADFKASEKEFDKLMSDVGTKIKEKSSKGIAFMKKGFQGIGKVVKKIGSSISMWIKGAGIGVLVAAAAGIYKIFQKIFSFNVGGIATAFNKIFATFKIVGNKLLLDFIKFLKQFEPIIKPLVNMVTNFLVNGMKAISGFLSGLMKSKGFASMIGKYISFVVDGFKTLFSIGKKIVSDVFGGFNAGGAGFGKILKNIFTAAISIGKAFIGIVSIVTTILSKLGIFKAIGFVIKVVFLAVSEIIKEVVGWIEKFIAGLSWITDLIFKTNSAPMASNNNTSSTTVTNNVSVNSASPINEENAGRIGNIFAGGLTRQTQLGGGY